MYYGYYVGLYQRYVYPLQSVYGYNFLSFFPKAPFEFFRPCITLAVCGVVVKIMVLFGVPIIIGAGYPKRDLSFDNYPYELQNPSRASVLARCLWPRP